MDKTIEKKCEEVIEYRFSNPQKAYDICCEILEYGIASEEPYVLAYARLYMGDTLFSLGKFSEAIDNMLLAEKLERKYGYEDLLVKNYNITGIIYVNQGDGLLGLDYYCRALELAKKRDDQVMEGMLYNNIGALLHNTGESAEATEYFQKCYELCEKREEKEKRKINNKKQYCVNIGLGYLTKGNYELAKKYLDIASGIEDVKTTESEGVFYFPAAEINRIVDYVSLYYRTGDYESAYKEAKKILTLPKEVFNEVEAFRHFIELAETLIKMKYYEEAEELLAVLGQGSTGREILKYKIQLCENWIRYYKATGEKELLQKCYKEYFELYKQNKENENLRVIQAIDNRYKLEYERMTNEQLSANTRELLKTSEIDELTGISNRYGLKKSFNKLYEIGQFQGKKICIGIFDIDRFKSYNDEYGHLKGDECLKEIAQILLDTAGDEYFVSRYGGDEFVLLGIDKSDGELKEFLNKLFENIRSARMPFLENNGMDHVTISMGVVNREAKKGCCLSEFIHDADRNLYKAKKMGRNRFVLESV